MNIKRMCIGLTGYSGFIGSHLLGELIKRDVKVVILGRQLNEYTSNLVNNNEIEFINYDLVNKNQNGKINDLDCLVHLAGFIPKNSRGDDFNKSMEINFYGTYNLLKDQKDIGKVVFASTVDVYGSSKGIKIKEQYPTNPLSYYGLSKLMAEKYLGIYSKENNIISAVLRYSHVYGPNDTRSTAIPNFMKAIIKDQQPIIYNNGANIRDYVFVSDVVDATISAIEKNCEGVYNIASGKGYSLMEIFNKIKSVSSKEILPIFKSSEEPTSRFFFDISRAKNDLSYLPKIAIDEGLNLTFEWFKKNCL